MVEKNPFDVILKLVINGEVDPWKIDIVELAEKYMNEIIKMELPDLRVASKILSGAVILLKMKAEALDIESNKSQKKISRRGFIGIKRFYTIEEIAYILKKYAVQPINYKINKRKNIKRKKVKSCSKISNILEIPLVQATLEEVIQILKKEIKKLKGKIPLSELKYPNKAQTFVALMFLNYEDIINLYQYENFGEIYIYISSGSKGI